MQVGHQAEQERERRRFHRVSGVVRRSCKGKQSARQVRKCQQSQGPSRRGWFTGEDGEDVHFALVGEILSCSQSQTRRNDTLPRDKEEEQGETGEREAKSTAQGTASKRVNSRFLTKRAQLQSTQSAKVKLTALLVH